MSRLKTMARFAEPDAEIAQEQEVEIEIRIIAKIPVNCIPSDIEDEVEDIMKDRKKLSDVMEYVDEEQEIDWDFY